MPTYSFPETWRKDVSNIPTMHMLRLLRRVSKLMPTLIIGHEGNLGDDGDHLFVSGYLKVCATLAHLLFFLFQKHKTDFIPAQQ